MTPQCDGVDACVTEQRVNSSQCRRHPMVRLLVAAVVAVSFGKDPKLESGELEPGGTASGWLTFEAPLADTVVLLYEPVSGMIDGSAEWTVTINQ